MSPRISSEETAKRNAARLVDYASKNLYLSDYDKIYVLNLLSDELALKEPYEGDLGEYDFYTVTSELSEYAVKKKIIGENDRLRFETKLIGIVMPSPSKVVEMFDETASYDGSEAACNFLYKLSEDCAYLRRPDIDKNIIWEHDAPRGKIIVTINLSKPEKTPEQVRLAKEAKTGYPKCPLCAENLGFAGNAASPARQTIRTVPFELDGEEWFMQYSPYSYFEEHMIAVSKEHRPMCVTAGTFRRMLDFLEMFPHYFIGSNAALPIVGGSILAHDHYQGGKKVLPLFERGARKYYPMPGCADVSVSVADWYNSVVRLESKNRSQILNAVEKFRKGWNSYSDKSADIIASDTVNGESVQHNAITPIASVNKDGEYRFDLILRNNRTDEKHPFGIFHPDEELHNIKQESIGIIEVMGLFILPGRLAQEMKQISELLTGKTKLDFRSLAEESHPLHKHLGMIAQLAADQGTALSDEKADEAVRAYINLACEKILDTTAVFKNTPDGQAAFDKFVNSVIYG